MPRAVRKEARADPLAYLDERLSVAVHEAGHAVAFHALLGKASAVRIRSSNGKSYGGWTDYPHTERDYTAFAWLPRRGGVLVRREHVYDADDNHDVVEHRNPTSAVARYVQRLRQAGLIISTAGYAAQAIHHRTPVVFGRDTRDGDAAQRRQDIRVLQALGERRSANELARDADERTLALLRARWPAVMQLAAALDELLHLSAKQVAEILT